MRRSSLLIIAVAFAVGGCTHLETRADYSTGSDLQAAVPGTPYALPDLHYELEVAHAITACPREFLLQADGQTVQFWDDGLTFQTKVGATRHYVAGERFLADYQSLASFMKTSGYILETYPNGVLKSLNVSAEDQTAPLIKDAVAIGLGVARLAGAGSVSSIFKSKDISSAAALKDKTPPPPLPIESVAQALVELREAAVPTRFPACRDEIARSRASVGAAVGAAITANADLMKISRQVARHSLIAGNERSDHTDLEKLDKALADQADAEDRVEAAKSALESAAKELIFTDKLGWTARSNGVTTPLPPTDTKRLDKLLLVQMAPVLRAAEFNQVWQRMSPTVRATFREQFKDLVKAYGVEKRDPPREPSLPSDRIVCATNSVADCVVPGLTLYPSLTAHSAPNVGGVPRGTKTISPSSEKSSPGLFIRSQQLADFRICIGQSAVSTCPSNRIALEERGVPAPQLGQLRFLPFSNRPFEAAKLSLAMREDGSVEKFSYDRTRAMTSGSEALKDAVVQAQAFQEKLEKEKQDKLTAARAEEIADVTHQITMLTKQKELLALQSPPTPTDEQLMAAETARLNAEIALLNARRSRIEAAALLLAASGGQ